MTVTTGDLDTLLAHPRLGSRLARAAFAVSLLLPACRAPDARQPDTAYLDEEDASEADQYMPLEDRSVFVYDTSTDHGEGGVMTVQVRRTGKGTADLRVGGSLEHVRIDASGLRYAEGGYLLKVPLEPAATWDGKLGLVHVEKTGDHVEVPAGLFDDCIRTEETGGGGSGAAVFCRRVGLVSLEQVDPRGTRRTAVLRRFGPRLDALAAGGGGLRRPSPRTPG